MRDTCIYIFWVHSSPLKVVSRVESRSFMGARTQNRPAQVMKIPQAFEEIRDRVVYLASCHLVRRDETKT